MLPNILKKTAGSHHRVYLYCTSIKSMETQMKQSNPLDLRFQLFSGHGPCLWNCGTNQLKSRPKPDSKFHAHPPCIIYLTIYFISSSSTSHLPLFFTFLPGPKKPPLGCFPRPWVTTLQDLIKHPRQNPRLLGTLQEDRLGRFADSPALRSGGSGGPVMSLGRFGVLVCCC